MAKLTGKQVQSVVLTILEGAKGGIQWVKLVNQVHEIHPETPKATISGAVNALLNSGNGDIVKVSRGTYRLTKYQDSEAISAIAQDEASANEPVVVQTAKKGSVSLLESDFYLSFAEWLTHTADEVNVAVPLGGSILKGKWGTPDVIGVLKPRAQDILKFEPQIVSAEIKIDPSQPVVAFGQAVAYRLFSHKSYIVVPNSTSEEDQDRLKTLCSIHGVGLVVFDLDKETPNYTGIVLPMQASPDMFYANQMLHRLLEAAPALFNKLF